MLDDTKIKPVTILTGFLGAGKTTYLNELLKQNPNRRYAIIENEIGQEGVDAELLLRKDCGFRQLDNGCICCTMNGDLYEVLKQFSSQRDSFDELIIECTGIANPAPIAEPFLAEPFIRSIFPLKQVVCLVDAEQIEDQLSECEESIQQIAFSDVILLNKADLVHGSYIELLRQKISEINPFSTVLAGRKNNYPIAEIAMINHKTPPVKFSLGVAAPAEFSVVQKKQFKHGDIVSLSFYFEDDFEMQQLYHRMYQFLMFQSRSIYRMKGLFNDPTNSKKIILQSVGDRLGIEEGNEWQQGEKRYSKVIFIGRRLQINSFEKMLSQCLKASAKTLV